MTLTTKALQSIRAHPIISVCVAMAGLIGISGAINAPEFERKEAARLAEQKKNEELLAQATAAAKVKLEKRCTEQIEDVLADARAKIKAKNYAAATSQLTSCKGISSHPGLAPLLASSINLADQAEKAELRSKADAERRKRKSEGVRIGMTQDAVLASSWGKPHRINRTITARRNHEQWVYGGNNYLYFEDGVLVSIQN